jgi:hypothetical protein
VRKRGLALRKRKRKRKKTITQRRLLRRPLHTKNKVLSNTKNTKNRQSVKRLNLVLAPLLVYFIIPDFKNRKFGKWVLEWDFQKPPKKISHFSIENQGIHKIIFYGCKGWKNGGTEGRFSA